MKEPWHAQAGEQRKVPGLLAAPACQGAAGPGTLSSAAVLSLTPLRNMAL